MNENRGLLSTYAHGVLDYVIGLALLFAPNIFGFAELGGAAEIVPRILGIGILGMALLTNYELGIVKAIPFRAHKAIDFFAGLYLAASPFIHGFSDMPANAWVPHVIVGAVVLLASLATRPYPMESRSARHAFS